MRLFPKESIVIPLTQAASATLATLEAATEHRLLDRLFKDQFTGSVASDRIVLRHRRWWWRNHASPLFEGCISEDGRAIVGSFRQPLVIQLAVGALLLLILLLLPVAIAGMIMDGVTLRHLQSVAFLALMFLFGLALPHIGWLFGRSDVKQITDLLQHAAASPGVQPATLTVR